MTKEAAVEKLQEQKETIAQLNDTICRQNEQIAVLQESLKAGNAAIEELREQIAYLTGKLFGSTSEKRKEIPGQLCLFDEAEQEASKYEEEERTVREHKRKPKRTSEDTFRGIPVREEIIELPEEEKVCGVCGKELVYIGKELVRKEFRFTRAKGEVVEIYVQTFKCPSCTEGRTPEKSYEFVKSRAPQPLIAHSYASESAVAWAMYQKYGNAIPLYRQEADWKQMGVPFSRATLANWILFCAENYFRPLYDYFYRELLKREFLMADETSVQVLHEPGRKAQNSSYMWLLRSGEDGHPPIVYYRYTRTRAGENAKELLKGFHGYLETDGYQGYAGLDGVKRCCCWAHMRRYFIEAVPQGKAYDYSNPAVQGVQFCSRLFEVERSCKEKGYEGEKRKEYRDRKARPVVESFWKWLDRQRPVKGTRFQKAVTYAQNQREELSRYLEDGRCSFSNNLSENAIRPFTVGRKNWLFSNSEQGAQASAIVYTMVEMAKLYELDIYEYLRYVLESRVGKETPEEELERLSPWNPQLKRN